MAFVIGGQHAHVHARIGPNTRDSGALSSLLNCAAYFMPGPKRSPDDPWDALKRLVRRESSHPVRDVRSMLLGAGLLGRALA